MKIIIESHIPYLHGLLEPYAQVEYLEPESITPSAVREADALVVRTRTHCDAHLLDGSNVKLICTATIGFDHIDTAYCEAHDIRWVNAPGCNAQGVADYVAAALHYLDIPTNAVIGIVGVGHVGTLVAAMAGRRGNRVLLCDPFRAEKEPGFVSLETIAAQADVITFHTPLTKGGPHPTYHLANVALLTACKPDALIINAARGGVVDEEALLAAPNPCVIDCWEGEPELNPALLGKAALGTFHIAGYTKIGKYNASIASLTAICDYFGLPTIDVPDRPADAPEIWDIEAVSQLLKAQPLCFEQLRAAYRLR